MPNNQSNTKWPCIILLYLQITDIDIIPNPKNNNKKCDDKDRSDRVFDIRGKNANEKNCKKECAKNGHCVAFSGIWNNWCIGCKVKLNVPMKGTTAFGKMERSKMKI